MPSPAQLPAIQLMAQQAVGPSADPQPAQAPAVNLQPPLQPAPSMATALPQPQPAPLPAQQPLPQAVPLPVASAKPPTPAQVLVPAGLYLGHGVMPLPQRLLTKILNLEFVEMQDLLPEAWLALTDDDSVKCCATSAAGGRKRRPPPSPTYSHGFRDSHPWRAHCLRNTPQWCQNFWRIKAPLSSATKTTTAWGGSSMTEPSGGRWPSPRT